MLGKEASLFSRCHYFFWFSPRRRPARCHHSRAVLSVPRSGWDGKREASVRCGLTSLLTRLDLLLREASTDLTGKRTKSSSFTSNPSLVAVG